MTSEEVKAAIERLQGMRTADRDLVFAVCRAFFDGSEVTGDELHYALIELLEQADPDTHIELPKDADGEPIHLSDEVESDSHEDGRVIGIEYREDGLVRIGVRPHEWDVPTWRDPAVYRHCRYHEPTVESVLHEFVKVWIEADSEGDVFAEYAAKLREVMADE